MIQGSYDKIFEIIKVSRGFTLDDKPSSLQEIMEAFDVFQNTRINGIQIAQKLLKDTRLWLGILKRHLGVESPKYMVASNKIAYNCMKILYEQVECTCSRCPLSDLQPQIRQVLTERVIVVLKLLDQIKDFYMLPEMQRLYQTMVSKLLIAQEHLSAFGISD